MTERTKALYLSHATTAASWYLNTQSTADRPWGDIYHGADEGRFIYEVFKGSPWRRGMGVWGQALAVMNLLDLAGRTNDVRFRNAGMAGVRYLLSLQCLDCRCKELQGAFWEHYPNDVISLVRDAATGCFALNYLYARTGDKDYLERARLFCDWYMAYGSKSENCWPYLYFDFKTGKGHSRIELVDPATRQQTLSEGIDGDWQAGGSAGVLLHRASERRETVSGGGPAAGAGQGRGDLRPQRRQAGTGGLPRPGAHCAGQRRLCVHRPGGRLPAVQG